MTNDPIQSVRTIHVVLGRGDARRVGGIKPASCRNAWYSLAVYHSSSFCCSVSSKWITRTCGLFSANRTRRLQRDTDCDVIPFALPVTFVSPGVGAVVSTKDAVFRSHATGKGNSSSSWKKVTSWGGMIVDESITRRRSTNAEES